MRRQTQQLPPLEIPKALQDVKTDLVQLFLTNMASDEVSLMAVTGVLLVQYDDCNPKYHVTNR